MNAMAPAPMPQPGVGPDTPYQEEAPSETVTIDAVVALLRDERMRNFRIDVETDQMIQPDEQAEKAAAVELVTSVGQYLGTFGPIVKEMPQLGELAGELLMFALRRYRAGRDLEECVEKAMASVGQALSNPPPPMPDPVEQAKTQREQIAAQAEMARGQQDIQKGQQDMALRDQQHQQEMAQKDAELQAKLAEAQHEAQLRHQEAQAQFERDQQMADAQHRRELEKHLAAMDRLRAEEEREMARHQREMERGDREHAQRIEQAKETSKAQAENRDDGSTLTVEGN